MKIAIIGTRGIPNNYGGFEQFAQFLSEHLVGKGHEVVVYNSHKHPYKEPIWNGVQIRHQFDPEYLIGTAGQFIYDLMCILDTRSQSFEIILQLGYTSSSIWSFLFPGNSKIVTNMDGLEWKRTKYSPLVKRFLRFAEGLAIRHSHYLVADSLGIQAYLKREFSAESVFIPYGATPFRASNAESLVAYNLTPHGYDLLIARLEPENNVDMILSGIRDANQDRPFLVIGNADTNYGGYLRRKFSDFAGIRFIGAIYDLALLNNLRYYSRLYFHGHSVGGTNPSLLEAMASQALICAHDNEFNRAILGDDSFYFNTENDVKQISLKVSRNGAEQEMIQRNYAKIENTYNWGNVNSQYLDLFLSIVRHEK